MAESAERAFADADGLRWTVRRFESSLAMPLPETHRGGWLTFECESTGWLRRLAPVPDDWATCDGARLREYLAAARRVRRRPKSGPLP